MTEVARRRLGRDGPVVSAVGLGCMPLSGSYGRVNEDKAVAMLRQALDAGVELLDTADVYGLGHNERLVGRALVGRRDSVFVATKFGNVFDELRGRAGRIDGTPRYVRQACEASLRRLGVETIDLYQQHRVDPATPIEETVGALADLVTEGKVRHIGLSEALAEDVRRAHRTHPLTSLQSEYSVIERGVENEALSTCDELGIGFLAYAPLGRGLLGGSLTHGWIDDHDKRASGTLYPRVGPDHLEANLALTETVREIAVVNAATVSQVALAWLLARRPFVIPIPGTTRLNHVLENLAASEVRLTASEIEILDDLARQVAGDRYGPGKDERRTSPLPFA